MAADFAARPKLHKAGRLASFPSQAPFRSSEFKCSRAHRADGEKRNEETEDLFELFKGRHGLPFFGPSLRASFWSARMDRPPPAQHGDHSGSTGEPVTGG